MQGLVLVTGLPGSGKTTLARDLAPAVGLPLLCRDDIKEALWDALGPGDMAWGRRLGGASAEVFFTLATTIRPAVLETFFHRTQIPTLQRIGGPFVEVHCACPPEVARARYAARTRHPCHFDEEYGIPAFDAWIAEDAEPLAIGPVCSVDTTTAVDVAAVAKWVRRELTSHQLA